MATQPHKQRGGPLALAFAAMTAIAVPQWETWEGTKQLAYRDIVGVLTICSGDTRNVRPGQFASMEECRERTAKIMTDFGGDVRSLAPGISGSPYEWGAHTTFAGNIGMGGYRRSSTYRLFVTGRRVEACRAMRLWNKAGGRVVSGLVNRREGDGRRIGEYELCLAGAIPADLGHPIPQGPGAS
jgi:GH24 family phage-related lysozyme (muramidase)